MAATVLSPADLWQRFARKAEAIGATVKQVVSAPDARSLLPSDVEPACTKSLRERFPEIAAGCAEVSRREPATNVVAPVSFAIAETGTVLVDEPRLDRGACLLSEHLWLVVSRTAIVPSLDDALSRVAERVREGDRYLTFMSGPSRTADIERELTVGVHGPRDVTIVVVGEDA